MNAAAVEGWRTPSLPSRPARGRGAPSCPPSPAVPPRPFPPATQPCPTRCRLAQEEGREEAGHWGAVRRCGGHRHHQGGHPGAGGEGRLCKGRLFKGIELLSRSAQGEQAGLHPPTSAQTRRAGPDLAAQPVPPERAPAPHVASPSHAGPHGLLAPPALPSPEICPGICPGICRR